MSLSLQAKVITMGAGCLLYASLIYGIIAVIVEEGNPKNWVSHAQARAADAEYKDTLLGRVLTLADANKNGKYSLDELAVLYDAAGVDVQLTGLKNNANGSILYSDKGGIQVNLRDSLDTGALEAAIRAYERK